MRIDTLATSEPYYATATELARRIRDNEISSTEVTEAFLARIVERNRKLKAIVRVFRTDARARAKEADEAVARGQSWGTLHGVAVTIKEVILMANTPSTLNSKRMKDFVAPVWSARQTNQVRRRHSWQDERTREPPALSGKG